MYERFLYRRDLLEGYLYAHVTSRDHDTVSSFEYLVDVLNAVCILDLGDNANIEPAEALSEFSEVVYISRRTDKACGDEVESHFRAELEVVHVSLAEIGHRELNSGNVDTLVVGELSAVDNAADDIGLGDLFCNELNNTVVDEYTSTDADVARELAEADASDLGSAGNVLSSESICVAVMNLNRLIIDKFAETYLRALCIEQSRNGEVELLSEALYLAEALLMGLVVAVGKVKASNVHACEHELAHNIFVICSRTYSAYYLGFSHVCVSP